MIYDYICQSNRLILISTTLHIYQYYCIRSLEDQKLSHFYPLTLVSLSSESSIFETAKHFYGLEKKGF